MLTAIDFSGITGQPMPDEDGFARLLADILAELAK